MIYSRHHSSPAVRRTKALVFIFGAVILLVGIVQWLAPQFFPGVATSFVRPFWRAGFAIESGALRSNQFLLAENESLKRELESLRVSMTGTAVRFLSTENRELKELLGRASSTPRILAAVLAKPPHAPYDELIIDLGSKDGISSTTLVYSVGGTPIGRVLSVLSETSGVRLFSSPGSSYEIFIGDSLIPAVAVGRGGGQYIAELPNGSPIAVGDVVSGSALGDGLFGEVISVTSESSSPFDIVLIAPPVNIFGIRWVLLDSPE